MAIWTGTDLDRPSGRFVRNLALSLSGGALRHPPGCAAAQAQDGGAAGTASDGAGAAHSGDADRGRQPLGHDQEPDRARPPARSGTCRSSTRPRRWPTSVSPWPTPAATAPSATSRTTPRTPTQIGCSALGPATNSGTAANASNGTAVDLHGQRHRRSATSRTPRSTRGQRSGQRPAREHPDHPAGRAGHERRRGPGQHRRQHRHGQRVRERVRPACRPPTASAGLAVQQRQSHRHLRRPRHDLHGQRVGHGQPVRDARSSSPPTAPPVATRAASPSSRRARWWSTPASPSRAPATTPPPATPRTTRRPRFIDQTIGDRGPPPTGPIGVASNNGEASIWSDGEANIRTGDAQAVGNESTHRAVAEPRRRYRPRRRGVARPAGRGGAQRRHGDANTGENTATGNASDNEANVVDQDDPRRRVASTSVWRATSAQAGSRHPTARASIVTGDAYAAGNRSTTDVEQNVRPTAASSTCRRRPRWCSTPASARPTAAATPPRATRSENDAFVTQDAVPQRGPGHRPRRASASSARPSQHLRRLRRDQDGHRLGARQRQRDRARADRGPVGPRDQHAGGRRAQRRRRQRHHGGNIAIGNESFSNANLTQELEIGQDNGGRGQRDRRHDRRRRTTARRPTPPTGTATISTGVCGGHRQRERHEPAASRPTAPSTATASS